MRYRPFGSAGAVASAVSLRFFPGDAIGADEIPAFVHAALEHGINHFQVPAGSGDLLDALGAALAPVDRDLVVVAVELGVVAGARDFSSDGLEAQIEDALARTGLDRLNAGVLDDPSGEELTTNALATLKQLRARGQLAMIGVKGVDEAIDAYIGTGAFNLVALPFNLTSGWRERRRILDAQRQSMAVAAYDPAPAALTQAPAGGFASGLLKRLAPKPQKEPLAGIGGYGFLHDTPGWTAEGICIAYALTDANISTVVVEPQSLEHLAAVAAVADREIPAALSAQVEMARFSGGPA